MSDLQTKGQRQLFKFHIEQNQAQLNAERKFWYRTNRWRFNTRDYATFPKFFRIKYPALVAVGGILLFDFTYGYKAVEGHH